MDWTLIRLRTMLRTIFCKYVMHLIGVHFDSKYFYLILSEGLILNEKSSFLKKTGSAIWAVNYCAYLALLVFFHQESSLN